jgi:hypothetical protein
MLVTVCLLLLLLVKQVAQLRLLVLFRPDGGSRWCGAGGAGGCCDWAAVGAKRDAVAAVDVVGLFVRRRTVLWHSALESDAGKSQMSPGGRSCSQSRASELGSGSCLCERAKNISCHGDALPRQGRCRPPFSTSIPAWPKTTRRLRCTNRQYRECFGTIEQSSRRGGPVG